jgi:hypothetical protein
MNYLNKGFLTVLSSFCACGLKAFFVSSYVEKYLMAIARGPRAIFFHEGLDPKYGIYIWKFALKIFFSIIDEQAHISRI